MQVQETKQATVKGTTAWVTKLSYTRDEALADKVRAAGAWERGEISSRTLAAIKAHISRRTGTSEGVSQQAVVVAAPVVKKAPAKAETIIDATGGKLVEAIEQLTQHSFERMAQNFARTYRKMLEPVREVWALGFQIDPVDIFRATMPIVGPDEDHLRRMYDGNAYRMSLMIAEAMVERDYREWLADDREGSRYLGIRADADEALLEKARAEAERQRQTMVAKFLTKVMPIIAAREDFYGVSQIGDRRLVTEHGECCFKFWFRDGSNFEAQTMVVEHGEWGGRSFTRYPLTFHKIVSKGEKVGFPCLETAYATFIQPKEGLGNTVMLGLRAVISGVSDEGLMRLISWPRLDTKGKDIAVTELRQEKRWSGRYYRSEDELKWLTPKRRAAMIGDQAVLRQHIEEAAGLASLTLSSIAMNGRG